VSVKSIGINLTTEGTIYVNIYNSRLCQNNARICFGNWRPFTVKRLHFTR